TTAYGVCQAVRLAVRTQHCLTTAEKVLSLHKVVCGSPQAVARSSQKLHSHLQPPTSRLRPVHRGALRTLPPARPSPSTIATPNGLCDWYSVRRSSCTGRDSAGAKCTALRCVFSAASN